jgi:hypothetical protein
MLGISFLRSCASLGKMVNDYGSYEEIGGFVRIIPKHNRDLFDALKERAMKLAEVTLPKLTK